MMERELTERVNQIKARHERDLLRRPEVVGVAVGLREDEGARSEGLVIKVFVSPSRGPSTEIPAELDGVPVEVIESGDFVAG